MFEKPTYIFKKEEFDRYVSACVNASFFIDSKLKEENKNYCFITPFRGAKPLVELINYCLLKRDIQLEEYQVATSGFIQNREEVIPIQLSEIFNERITSGKELSFIFVDSFISGSSFKNFKKALKQKYLPAIINELGLKNEIIDFKFIALKQNYEKNIEVSKTNNLLRDNILFNSETSNFGLERIFTEDDHVLLGVDYTKLAVSKEGKRIPLFIDIKSDADVLVLDLDYASNKKSADERFMDFAENRANFFLENNKEYIRIDSKEYKPEEFKIEEESLNELIINRIIPLIKKNTCLRTHLRNRGEGWFVNLLECNPEYFLSLIKKLS